MFQTPIATCLDCLGHMHAAQAKRHVVPTSRPRVSGNSTPKSGKDLGLRTLARVAEGQRSAARKVQKYRSLVTSAWTSTLTPNSTRTRLRPPYRISNTAWSLTHCPAARGSVYLPLRDWERLATFVLRPGHLIRLPCVSACKLGARLIKAGRRPRHRPRLIVARQLDFYQTPQG